MTSHAGRLAADFEPGQSYRLVFDKGRQIYFVDAADGRSVATVPVGFGGHARTRSDAWEIQPERNGRRWGVVARTLDGTFAGSISEALMPCTFRLRVGDAHEYRVTESPIFSHWAISHAHAPLARITGIQAFARAQPPKEPKTAPAGMVSPFVSPKRPARALGIPAGEIRVGARATESPAIALAILLTLEVIKAEAGMPLVPYNDGSGTSY